jgi:hypothetical protein
MELSGLFSQDIPEAIAPARPVTAPIGQTIPMTTSTGVSGSMDSVGNIWSEAGQYLGNVATIFDNTQTPSPVPAPTVPSTSTTAKTSGSSTSTSPGSGSALATLAKWAAGIVTGSKGLDLEDMVFIVLGLMLVGAAVFSFKETQTVVQNVTKGASKAAELAAA